MSTMLRDSHTASSNFGLNDDSWTKIPKPGFLYYIRFVRSNAGLTSNDWAKGVGIIAKRIDRPKITFETETLNQYNRKRVIQKRMEYEAISMTFHDTVDNKVLHMFEDYQRFYYGDPRQSDATDWSWDIMAASMNQGSANAWGYIPPTGNADNVYFFSHIELYIMYGGTYSLWHIINPKVKSFSPSDMEYSSSEGAEITMTWEYEGVVYKGNNMSLSDQDGLLTEMGLSASSFYEPRTSSGSGGAGNASTYSGQGAEPVYGTSQLSSVGTVASASTVSAVSRSSSQVDSDLTFNSIFSGIITRPTDTSTTLVSGTSTQGDNIAKRIWNGMK
jgi:hypothetical protein